MNKPRILALFGNIAYFGQERANIDVFNLLNEKYELLVLVNNRGFHHHLKPIFHQLNIPYKEICFPWLLKRPFNIGRCISFIVDFILCNYQFVKEYRQYKPTHIHIANDGMYMNFFPSLFFVKAKIIYRLGDRPATWWFPFKILWKYIISRDVFSFVCDSLFIKDKLELSGRKNIENDVVLYVGPPMRFNQESTSEVVIFEKIKELKDKGNLIITFVGRISREKGCDDLMELARLLKRKNHEFQLIICGNIDHTNRYSIEYKSLIESSDLKDNILLTNYISNVPKLLELSDIHVAPTLTEEPYGLVVTEAKMAKKLSIIYSVGGMKELVSHKSDGYVCTEHSAESLYNAIVYYIENPALIHIHGINAFKSFNQLKISKQNFEQAWMSIYEK